MSAKPGKQPDTRCGDRCVSGAAESAGRGGIFYILGPLSKTKGVNKYITLVVDLLSRHADSYALDKREIQHALSLAEKLAND